MSTAPTGRLRWAAGRDLVAHCHRGSGPRTLCNAVAIAERLAWPQTSRCPRCQSVMTMPPTASVGSPARVRAMTPRSAARYVPAQGSPTGRRPAR